MLKKLNNECSGKALVNVLNSIERLMKLKTLIKEGERIDLEYVVEIQDVFVNITKMIALGLKRENGNVLLHKLNEHKVELGMHNKNIDMSSVGSLVESLKTRYKIECNDIKRTMDEHLTESDEVEDMRNALRTNASQFILKYGKFNE